MWRCEWHQFSDKKTESTMSLDSSPHDDRGDKFAGDILLYLGSERMSITKGVCLLKHLTKFRGVIQKTEKIETRTKQT